MLAARELPPSGTSGLGRTTLFVACLVAHDLCRVGNVVSDSACAPGHDTKYARTGDGSQNLEKDLPIHYRPPSPWP